MTAVVRDGLGDHAVDGAVVADLGDVPLSGPPGVVWGLDSGQLNANLVTLAAGEAIAEHVNSEVDVLIVVKVGSGVVVVDGVEHAVGADSLVLVPRGTSREIRSTRRLCYLTVHARRAPLTPKRP